MVISFSYLMIEAVRMKRIINHELLIKGKIKMKKILVMGGVGSIDSILRKDESELHDISIWQDNNWAAEMIKHIQ